MEAILAPQRLGGTNSTTVSITTGAAAVSTALTIPTNMSCEIVNLDVTNAATFSFTVNGASAAVPATTTDRCIPAFGIMLEHLPQGASFVSALAVAGTPILRFTPIVG